MISMSDLLGNTALGAQSTQPVTNLSAHVDGGDSPVNAASTQASADQTSILYGAVAVVVAAIVLLWFFGGIAFRGLPTL